jgi:ssDNA-binding replication factor A large subunit
MMLRGIEKMVDNYNKLVERISNSAGVESGEIERKVEAKRAKLSGLVSREGAAQIVAAELGVNLDQEKLKISELVQGMRKANFIGKIIEVGPIREFNKNGREGKVANLRVADETGNLRVVLWDTNHIGLIENEKIKQGDIIEISNGNIRDSGEVHLGSFSDIKISKEEIKEVVEGKSFGEKELRDIKAGQSIKVRAFVMQSFEPRYFEVVKETGRKPTEEDKKEGKDTEKRALLNIVLDDGTETVRAVIFGDEIEKLGLSKEEIFDLEKFEAKKKEILGEEKFFQGSVRNNDFTNSIELSIESVGEVQADELVRELEAKTS